MICAYAISKNEEENVARFIEQTKLFDQVVVLDTGSEDKTIELLREGGVKVEQKTYDEFNFSEARTDSMKLADDEVEWFMWIDFNEKLEITQEQIDYIKNCNADGFKINCYDYYNEDYLEHKLKIHRRDKYVWLYAVHEYLGHVSDDVILEYIDVKITKKKRKSYEKDRFQTMICERELNKELTNSDDIAHYSWWAIQFYKDNEVFYRVAHHSQNYLKHTQAYTIEFRIYCFINGSDYEMREGRWDKAIDLGFHALSESIIFRDRKPECFQSAINNLARLGVDIMFRNIQNGVTE